MTPREIYQLLNDNKIAYQSVNHPAVFTTAEADQYVQGYSFARTKNLFLHTHNRQNYFLYVLPANSRFNEKAFRQVVGTSRLSFASPDEMKQILGVTPGMVSPFNLLNDQQHRVSLIIAQEVLKGERLIGVHPNTNTQTVILKTTDLLTLLKRAGIDVQIINS